MYPNQPLQHGYRKVQSVRHAQRSRAHAAPRPPWSACKRPHRSRLPCGTLPIWTVTRQPRSLWNGWLLGIQSQRLSSAWLAPYLKRTSTLRITSRSRCQNLSLCNRSTKEASSSVHWPIPVSHRTLTWRRYTETFFTKWTSKIRSPIFGVSESTFKFAYQTIYFNLKSGLKSALLNVFAQAMDGLVWSGGAYIFPEAKVRSFFQTKAIVETID